MDEYIDRERIEKFFDGIYDCADLTFYPNDHCCAADDCGHCKWYETKNAIQKRILSIPAADVRPVVTCSKCKYGKYTGTEWFCDKHSGHADKFGEDASYHEYHSKHWFCADGEERKHE